MIKHKSTGIYGITVVEVDGEFWLQSECGVDEYRGKEEPTSAQITVFSINVS